MTRYTIEYASWQDWTLAAKNATYAGLTSGRARATARDTSLWAGTETMDGMIRYALHGGWSTDQDRELTETIAAAVGSHVQIPTYQVTDDPAFAETFDVGALTQGDPDHWIAPVYTDATMTGKGRVITVVANTGANGSVPHHAMIRRGALAVAMTEALERAGYPVELIGVDVCTAEKVTAEYRIAIKAAGQPLDRERALIALAHPGQQRRLAFSAYERDDAAHPEIQRVIGNSPGLGRAAPHTLPSDISLPEIARLGPPYDSDHAAIQWALAELTRIGAILEPAA